jgi:hypothetical protein
MEIILAFGLDFIFGAALIYAQEIRSSQALRRHGAPARTGTGRFMRG